MKLTKMKGFGLLASTLLIIVSASVYAGESHMAEALKHAEAAAKADNSKAIVEHAEKQKLIQKPPMSTWMLVSRV